MEVPRWSNQVMLAAGAVCLGWMAKDTLGGMASSTAEAVPSAESEDASEELVRALSALESNGAPQPVELTIVVGEGGDPVMSSPSDSGIVGGRAQTNGLTSVVPSRTRGGNRAPHLATPRGLGQSASEVSAWSPLPVMHQGPPAAPRHPSTEASTSVPAFALPGGQALNVHLSPETGTVAIGEHIVIAYDDSIVLVGDNGQLTGNTGDASQGAVVALDAQDSEFTTSLSGQNDVVPSGSAGTITTGGPGSTPQAGEVTVAADGAMSALSASDGTAPNVSSSASPLVSPIVSFGAGRAVDIAGYEDHSLAVRGARNIVTYDDSNVFIDRDGKINANTGDLDSAGLNAVDTVRSTVWAGWHCDDGCDDESIIQAEAGVFDEGDVAIDGSGNVVWAPDGGGDDTDDEGDDSLPDDDGDDDDGDDDESDDGDVTDPVEPPETRDDADSGVDPAENPSGDSLVVGGDGYDDLGIRVDGDDNVATYDDSNVVLGGTGDVNAQIGDADTGGVALMGTADSEVYGGNSR